MIRDADAEIGMDAAEGIGERAGEGRERQWECSGTELDKRSHR